MAVATLSDLRQQTGVTTTDQRVEVDVTSEALKVGTHIFRLTVKDEAGNTHSKRLTIEVIDANRPNAEPGLLDMNNGPIENNIINAGVSFKLTGEDSSDPEGEIVEYNWVLLPG